MKENHRPLDRLYLSLIRQFLRIDATNGMVFQPVRISLECQLGFKDTHMDPLGQTVGLFVPANPLLYPMQRTLIVP